MKQPPHEELERALQALATANVDVGRIADEHHDAVAFSMAAVVGGLIAAVRARLVTAAEMQKLVERIDAWEIGN